MAKVSVRTSAVAVRESAGPVVGQVFSDVWPVRGSSTAATRPESPAGFYLDDAAASSHDENTISAEGGPLVTPPAPPAISPNTFQKILLDQNYSVASGQVLYASNLPVLASGGTQASLFQWPDLGKGVLTNNGTIWVEESRIGYGASITWGWASMPPEVIAVVNNGLMVCHSVNGAASVIVDDFASGHGGITNTGEIYAISDTGFATAISTHSFNLNSYEFHPGIFNSGVIAAKGAVEAWTIQCAGGLLTNTATGKILADGADAIAISFWSDGTINNAGLIEARATPGGYASVAIITDSLTTVPESEFGHHEVFINNTGTIRGDFAILAGPYNWYPAQLSFQVVTNETSGVIDGLVVLGLGDDVLVNRGFLDGDVYLEEGNDRFDTSAGAWVGVADLGWGDDEFIGSEAGDKAYGDRDSDELEGRGGHDLLLGGLGDDVLIGGAGNDGLYGEYGADRIITQGGDNVVAGDQDDRVELGDLTFANVDGGGGFDTLVLPNGGRVFDLSAAIATGRIVDFEAIELKADQVLVIRAGDVAALAGGETQLFVTGVASDRVDLVGAWVQGVQQTIGGITYQAWSLSGSTVLVQSDVEVVAALTSTPGATGLDAIADGSAAPVPLAGDFSSNVTTMEHFEIRYDLVIAPYEIWENPNGEYPWDMTLQVAVHNYGSIICHRATGTGPAIAVFSYNGGVLVNDGLISAVASPNYIAVGIWYENAYELITNNGIIVVEAVSNQYAEGIFSYFGSGVLNNGSLTVTCVGGNAVGIDSGQGSPIVNNGTIVVSGASSVAIETTAWASINNSGTITATATGTNTHAYGIFAAEAIANDAGIHNSGTINAEIALYLYYASGGGTDGMVVENSGVMNGRVEFSQDQGSGRVRNSTVNNSGTINGAITFGAGNDVYNGAAGHQGGGLIDGFIGDDILTAGDGDQQLAGGAGDDVLSGGAGSDWAVYRDALGGVTVDLNLTTAQNTGGDGVDTLVGIESVEGSAFNDTLTGNAGANGLRGGKGDDQLTGGAGDDTIVFGSRDGLDTVTGFTVGGTDDRLSIAGYTVAALYQVGADVRVLLDGASWITLKGVQASQITLADINLSFSVKSVLAGGSSADALGGGAGIDWIDGGAGGDTLTGGAGHDLLVGGDGDDVLIGGEGDDGLNGGLGIDLADYSDSVAAVNITLADGGHDTGFGYDTFTSIEGLRGSAFADRLLGDGGANRVEGGAGDDQIFGYAGADTMMGGLGADTIEGGSGNDTFVFGIGDGIDTIYDFQTGGTDDQIQILGYTTFTLVQVGNDAHVVFDDANYIVVKGRSIQAFTDADFNIPIPLYLQRGSDSADTLVGTTGRDQIDGLDGNDYLRGLGGNDLLYGGAGDDILRGDGNDDLLDGGAGEDTADYGNSTGAVTVSLLIGGPQNTGVGLDTLIGIENLTGGSGNDSLTGDIFDNVLNGGGGSDTLVGGLGNDILDGGGAADLLDFSALGSSMTLDFTLTGPNTQSALGFDTLLNIEWVIATNFNDTLTGAGGSDEFWGGGGADTLSGGQANDNLRGGDGNDTLSGGDGDDYLQGDLGNDHIDGGAGIDSVSYYGLSVGVAVDLRLTSAQNTGGGGIDTIQGVEGVWGSNQNDTIIGNSAANILHGELGNDVLQGGLGDDILEGSTGADAYVFAAGDGNDTIFTWDSSDQIVVTGYSFYTIVQEGADTRLVFDSTNSILVKYTFGAWSPSAINIPLATTQLGTNQGETLTGSAGPDILNGLGGNDVLNGADGNDMLAGGVGDDNLNGGNGVDTVTYAAAAAGVTVSLALTAAQDTLGDGLDTLASIENLIGSSFNDTFIGDAGSNRLEGSAGNDTLKGADGADTLLGGDGDDLLEGGLGDDQLIGGAGTNDKADYRAAASAVTVNLSILTAQNTGGAGTDTLSGIEQVLGSAFNDTLTGDGLTNTLDGKAGNDVLKGGSGGDILIGGAGADALDGGSDLDYASYISATVGVGINLTTGVHTGDAAGDTFANIERYRLSAFADTFTGSAATDYAYGAEGSDTLSGAGGIDRLYGQADSDTLNGDAGNDILIGGLGGDVLNGGADRDTASYETMTAAVTLNLTTGVHTGDATGDTFNSIEIFWLTDFNDSFTGSAGDDEVRGANGVDTLNGAGGIDSLRGEAGNDILNGDDGDDFLYGGANADQLNGGAGVDTASYLLATAGVTLNLTTGTHTGEAAGDTFNSIEHFQLSNGFTLADSFTGSAGDDWVAGYKGVDTLNGMGGNDTLNGGAHDDIINGGDGADRIIGDTGNDSLTGGTGADQFRVTTLAFGADTIADFENGVDKIRVTGVAAWNDFSDVVVSTNGSGWAVVTFSDGSSITLTGMIATDVDASDFLWI